MNSFNKKIDVRSYVSSLNSSPIIDPKNDSAVQSNPTNDYSNFDTS